jgi:hypothetical protein
MDAMLTALGWDFEGDFLVVLEGSAVSCMHSTMSFRFESVKVGQLPR